MINKIQGTNASPNTQYVGLSTDTKPTTGVANGDNFVEMDTSTIYFYDAISGNWLPFATGGGGGGGTGNMVVTINDVDGVATADKTMREIITALKNGVAIQTIDNTTGIDMDNPTDGSMQVGLSIIGVQCMDDGNGNLVYFLSFSEYSGNMPTYYMNMYVADLDDYPSEYQSE